MPHQNDSNTHAEQGELVALESGVLLDMVGCQLAPAALLILLLLSRLAAVPLLTAQGHFKTFKRCSSPCSVLLARRALVGLLRSSSACQTCGHFEGPAYRCQGVVSRNE